MKMSGGLGGASVRSIMHTSFFRRTYGSEQLVVECERAGHAASRIERVDEDLRHVPRSDGERGGRGGLEWG